MDLIAEQEARSSAKVDAIVEAHKIADVKWARTERKIRALLTLPCGTSENTSTGYIANISETTDERIDNL